MRFKTKPAVFAADRVTSDMLMLVLHALIVGAAAAVLSSAMVVGLVALLG